MKGGTGLRLTPMRFKDYTWPHNPEIYSVEYRRRMAVHAVPFGRCVLQDLGGAYRVLEGEGAFAGADAYAEFLRLAEVFRLARGTGLFCRASGDPTAAAGLCEIPLCLLGGLGRL